MAQSAVLQRQCAHAFYVALDALLATQDNRPQVVVPEANVKLRLRPKLSFQHGVHLPVSLHANLRETSSWCKIPLHLCSQQLRQAQILFLIRIEPLVF